MRRVEKEFSGVETPLFEGMLVGQEVDEEGYADEHIEEVNAGDAAQGDDSVAHGEVPTITTEPSIPSSTPPTPPPQPPQNVPLTSQGKKNKRRFSPLKCQNPDRKARKIKVQDRLRYNDQHVLDRLGHRRQSAFDRLSEIYSPSTTKSRPGRTSSRDHPYGRSRPHRLGASDKGRPENKERFHSVGKSYNDSHSSHSYHDRDRSRHMKRRRASESPLSSISRSDSRATRVWFDELPPESIDSYKDLKATFLAYFMQQKKYVKERKGSSMFNPLTRTPKEILAAEAGKFQPPPPMVTPVEKRSSNKFCDFHNDKRHNTDECMQLKKQIEKLVRAGKLSHLIKEIKHGQDQSKVRKKETPAKDKPATIYMIQSWKRMTRQKLTQSFERVREITFLPLATSSGADGPLVIEAEIGRHMIHRMYVDGASSMEILYEHCFNRLQPKVKN
nr:reverse transcriptase domain-containing protein [Tanacetum cinerariifolium]